MSPPLFFRFYYLPPPRVSNNLQCPRSIRSPLPVHGPQCTPRHQIPRQMHVNIACLQNRITILYLRDLRILAYRGFLLIIILCTHASFIIIWYYFFLTHPCCWSNKTRIVYLPVYFRKRICCCFVHVCAMLEFGGNRRVLNFLSTVS